MPCGSYNKKTKKKKKKSNKKSRVSTLACAALICLCCSFKLISPSSGASDLNNGWDTPSMDDMFEGIARNLSEYLKNIEEITQ